MSERHAYHETQAGAGIWSARPSLPLQPATVVGTFWVIPLWRWNRQTIGDTLVGNELPQRRPGMGVEGSGH